MSRFVRVTVVVILVAGVVATYAARARRLSLALTADEVASIPARLARIPLRTEDPAFRGTREELEERIVELSGAEHYAAIGYRDEDGGAVRLHVGVAVRTGDWLHEPEVCLPTHGWTTADRALVPLWEGLPGVEPGARVWRMRLHKAGEELLVYYWFQWGDRIVTSRAQRAAHRFEGLLAGERDRPIQIVILYAPIDTSETLSEARVASLIRALWPDLFHVLSTGDSSHASKVK